jgi:phosphonate transport system substrate-binding protein
MTNIQSTPVRPSPRIGLSVLIAVVVVIVAAALVYLAVIRGPAESDKQLYQNAVMQLSGLNHPVVNKMSDRFVDANKDGVPDAPADAVQLIDPPTLTFSYVATESPEAYRDVFKDFTAHLSKQIGRPVEYVMFSSMDEELRALRDGKLQVAGLNTGIVPTAVNQAGFVPVATIAQADGNPFIHTVIIVPADSRIHAATDLRGQTLALTEVGSNSGFKAPMVSLKQELGLEPGRDYDVAVSGGHDQSIRGIADKTYSAAAVASDLLERALAHGEIKKEQYRVIFESAAYPPAAFGYIHTLKPELADKLRQAMLSFNFAGTSLEDEFAPARQTKLAAIDYGKDFESVRRIENATGAVETIKDASAEEPTTKPAAQAAGVLPQK